MTLLINTSKTKKKHPSLSSSHSNFPLLLKSSRMTGGTSSKGGTIDQDTFSCRHHSIHIFTRYFGCEGMPSVDNSQHKNFDFFAASEIMDLPSAAGEVCCLSMGINALSAVELNR